MKRRLISIIASLSIALGLSTSAFSNGLNYEEQRTEQYKKFYKEYCDKDYKVRKAGEFTKTVDGERKTFEHLEIMYGNNLHDNTRPRFYKVFDSYFSEKDKNGNLAWYFMPYTLFIKDGKKIPLENVDKENLPQAIKDILTLPEDMQKKVSSIAHYLIDGDVWIMLPSDTEEGTARKIFNHLKKLDEERDAKQEDYKGQIQPIIPTENQFLPFDPFFPPVIFVDENRDGKWEYAFELYCIDGSWFDRNAKKKHINLTQWFELNQKGPDDRSRKYDKPFKIMIDFDKQEGFDIEFYDKNHDGHFEGYKIIKENF